MMGYANTKFKTEKRKANVGERILITNAGWTFGDYDNGDVLTVVDSFGKNAVLVDGEDFPQITHEEYEVIVAENPPKPSKNERISQLESKVAELQAQVEAMQKRRKPAAALTQAPTVYNTSVNLGENSAKTARQLAEVFRNFGKTKPSPNEQRKALIERAKAFVADTQRKQTDFFSEGGNAFLRKYITRTEFVVNTEKRTVVAIIRGNVSSAIYTKAIAKCAPDDVFNADIGKAIALGRALGLDVSEFENAVKPTEVVVGMVVRGKCGYYEGESYKLTKSFEDSSFRYEGSATDWIEAEQIAVILDDTEAQY